MEKLDDTKYRYWLRVSRFEKEIEEYTEQFTILNNQKKAYCSSILASAIIIGLVLFFISGFIVSAVIGIAILVLGHYSAERKFAQLHLLIDRVRNAEIALAKLCDAGD